MSSTTSLLLAALAGLSLASLGLPANAMAQSAAATPPQVETPSGLLEGENVNGLNIFKGIPYAQPPLGPLRWAAPQPMPAWQGLRAARSFGPACLQKVARQEPEKSLKDGPQSEDCLTLNIWAPAHRSDGASALPVVVWVHGGSFRFGAGSLGLYDGSQLAHRGAIVVTLNYRLGLFGTFAHPDLLKGDRPAGNFGLLDVIQALSWVRDNVQAFGGDPQNVTLMGESAGGATVAYLMTSPLANGLFSKAIVESGALTLPEFSRDQAEATAARIAASLGADSLEKLRALPADKIRDAETGIVDTMPFVDGKVLSAGMRESFETGKAAAIPLLIGSNSAEAGFFGPGYWKAIPEELGAHWHDVKAACFGYGKDSDDACAEQIASEQFAGVTTRAVERAASKAAPVYAYRFDWVPPAERDGTRGAIHTAEIPYVFGHVAEDGSKDEASRRLSAELADRWIAFARTGSPNTDNSSNWRPFKAGEDESLLLIGADGSAMAANPANGLLDALEASGLKPRP